MGDNSPLLELDAVLGELLAAGQPTIEFLQLAQLGSQRPWIGDMAVLVGETGHRTGQGRQMGDAHVDANLATESGERPFHRTCCKLVAHLERDLPTPTRVRDCHFLDRRPAGCDQVVQPAGRFNGVQSHQLLGAPAGVGVLRLDERLREHQPDAVPRVVQPRQLMVQLNKRNG